MLKITQNDLGEADARFVCSWRGGSPRREARGSLVPKGAASTGFPSSSSPEILVHQSIPAASLWLTATCYQGECKRVNVPAALSILSFAKRPADRRSLMGRRVQVVLEPGPLERQGTQVVVLKAIRPEMIGRVTVTDLQSNGLIVKSTGRIDVTGRGYPGDCGNAGPGCTVIDSGAAPFGFLPSSTMLSSTYTSLRFG